jgi:hypothetical protein
MLRRVALVTTDVSEELSAFFIRVTIVGELETTLATRRNVTEDTILHSHRRENLKSYKEVKIQQSRGPSIFTCTHGSGRCVLCTVWWAKLNSPIIPSSLLQSQFHCSYHCTPSPKYLLCSKLKLWSSGQSSWLQIQRSRVRFPPLPYNTSISGFETGPTQLREDKWGVIWKRRLTAALTTRHPLREKSALLRRPRQLLSRYISHSDRKQRSLLVSFVFVDKYSLC